MVTVKVVALCAARSENAKGTVLISLGKSVERNIRPVTVSNMAIPVLPRVPALSQLRHSQRSLRPQLFHAASGLQAPALSD